MQRHLTLSVLFVFLTLQSCATPATSTPPQVVEALLTVTTSPTPAPPTRVTAVSTGIPEPTINPHPGPYFWPTITFARDPDPAHAARAFPSGIQEIYAIWDYREMADGLTIRRNWYRNGELWLTREEPWDFARYGASGTMKDISIHDDQNGLPDGEYELRLWINDVEQNVGYIDVPGRSFSIGRDTSQTYGMGGMVMSPDGLHAALIDVGKLTILDNQGNAKLLIEKDIAGVSWMPDNAHLVYSAVTSAENIWFDVTTDLILLDVSTGAEIVLNLPSGTDNWSFPLHSPIVSPDGNYVAAFVSGYGDACFAGFHVFFIELDPQSLAPVAEFNLDDFAGLPERFEDYYPAGDYAWQSPTVFKSGLRFTCTDGSQDGIFLIDLPSQSVTKIESLPKPEF